MGVEGKSVWVVEDGDYSDYHVIGVFSTRKNAKVIQDLVGGEIREWSLDPAIGELRAGLSLWRVLMLRNGDTESVNKGKLYSYTSLAGEVHIWRRASAPAFKGKGIQDCLDAEVWAKDEKHAVKIANETRVQMIATGKWK